MLPLQLAGLALAGKMLLSKYGDSPLTGKTRTQIKPSPMAKPSAGKTITVPEPLQTLFKGITSTLSQITKRPAVEDYDIIVKSFIPYGAKLLKPQYPTDSREIQLADLDGDSRDEIITSFMHNNEVKTVILKKQNENWHKIAEINNPEHNIINYRGIVNITGEGKKQLLFGMTSKGKNPTLYGYSLESNGVNKIFTRSYHRFEALEPPKSNKALNRTELAVWSKKDTDIYNIDVLHWNGSQLEPVKNITPYYSNNVVPYYVEKVKRAPYNASNWYALADTLVKTGAYRDALVAIDAGINQDHSSAFKEKFLALRKKIIGE